MNKSKESIRTEEPIQRNRDIEFIDLGGQNQDLAQDEYLGLQLAESEEFVCYDDEILSLRPKETICSSIVDAYLRLITSTHNKQFVSVGRAFYQHNNTTSPRVVSCLFPKDKIKDDTILLFPTLWKNHYWLNAINTATHEIDVYDSLTSCTSATGKNTYMDGLIQGLENELPESKGKWKFKWNKCPQQNDGHSCGAYTIAFAQEIMNGKPENIANINPDMRLLRNNIARALLKTTAAGTEFLDSNKGNMVKVYRAILAHVDLMKQDKVRLKQHIFRVIRVLKYISSLLCSNS